MKCTSLQTLAAAILLGSLPLSTFAHEHPIDSYTSKAILSDIRLLEATGVPILAKDETTGVAYAEITPEMEAKISTKAHEWGRCGGFEALPTSLHAKSGEVTRIFRELQERQQRNEKFKPTKLRKMAKNPAIEAALTEVSEDRLRTWVEWFSAYPTRFHKAPTANDHVTALKKKIEELVANAAVPVQVETVSHSSTPQQSLKVRITGQTRPNEIVVLGAHMDSTTGFWGGSKAPGADDNASGSSNLLEALRILIKQSQPQRTVEFFWYAGEEGGLLGSAEIARNYKTQGLDIIGVLQLDMTLHPGDGEFVLGSMTDFTSAWLRQYFAELNNLYIGARVIDDKCGYGCSDHASWHRQGYAALMPFEATFNRMNRRIHTANDVINSESSFKHSAMFSRVALAFAMDLGNSDIREP